MCLSCTKPMFLFIFVLYLCTLIKQPLICMSVMFSLSPPCQHKPTVITNSYASAVHNNQDFISHSFANIYCIKGVTGMKPRLLRVLYKEIDRGKVNVYDRQREALSQHMRVIKTSSLFSSLPVAAYKVLESMCVCLCTFLITCVWNKEPYWFNGLFCEHETYTCESMRVTMDKMLYQLCKGSV